MCNQVTQFTVEAICLAGRMANTIPPPVPPWNECGSQGLISLVLESNPLCTLSLLLLHWCWLSKSSQHQSSKGTPTARHSVHLQEHQWDGLCLSAYVVGHAATHWGRSVGGRGRRGWGGQNGVEGAKVTMCRWQQQGERGIGLGH